MLAKRQSRILRDVVKTKIVESIKKPIQTACEQFVKENRHVAAV